MSSSPSWNLPIMTSQSEVLVDIFHRLASKTDDARQHAAQDLKAQVSAYAQEYPGHDGLKGIWSDVFHRIFEISRSNSGNERLGAVAAIDAMLEVANEDMPDRALQKNLRLYEYLRPLLVCTDSVVMVAAAHVVGTYRFTSRGISGWFRKGIWFG
jgi:FKBP12-rapamycin complex-associated protein